MKRAIAETDRRRASRRPTTRARHHADGRHKRIKDLIDGVYDRSAELKAAQTRRATMR